MSNVSIKMCPPCLRTPVHHVSGTYTQRGRGGRELNFVLFKPEFDRIAQVDVPRKNNTVSSLSLWERAGVRGF
jgi:hypothetical protein